MGRRGANSDSLAQAGALIEGAEVVPLKTRGRARSAPAEDRGPASGGPGGGVASGGDGDQRPTKAGILGEDCPVVPLGTQNGLYFYLSALRELRTLKAKEHDGRNIISLLAPRSDIDTLKKVFPRYGKNGIVTGWDKEGAGELLMRACAFEGVWSAEGKVRGAGAHRDTDGGLVLHCGDMIQVPETDEDERSFGATRTWAHPGVIAGYVYPAAPRAPRPALEPTGPEAAWDLLALLKTWGWERPEVDPQLLLGWIAAALVCGALDWRPMVWLTGGKGTGKSTLWTLIRFLLGENGLLHASEVTEAWVRQTLKMRTLPVALDEIEADADGRRVANIIKLARLASSGGKIGRGGADHEAQDFVMRSAFFFSSILHAPLAPQDKSRIAVLDLLPLRGNAKPVIDAKTYGVMGRALLRRMVDHWDRLEGVIEAYRVQLAANGHDARGQDQFGTLLACADVLLWDADPEGELHTRIAWGKALAVDRAAAAEDDEPMLVIQRMATSALQGRGGDEPETLAMWVAKVLADTTDDSVAARAQKRLEMAGMAVVSSHVIVGGADDGKRKTKRYGGGPVPTHPEAPAVYVAVACAHQGLELLLRDTRWQGGVWNQALGRLAGAVKRVKVKIGGRAEWATLVPIGAFASEVAE